MLNILISLLIFTLPFEIIQMPLGGLDIRLHQIILACIVLVLLPRLFKKDPSQDIGKNIRSLSWYYDNIHIILLLGMWVMILIGGLLYGGDITVTFIRNIVLLGYIAVFYILYRYLNTRKRLYQALNMILCSTGILILIGLYEAIAFQLGWNSLQVFPGRVDSLLPEPNWFGMWLAIVYAITLPLCFYAQKFYQQILLWSLVLGVILMSILSVTRASWVAIIAITSFYILYNAIFVRKYKKLIQFIIILGSVIFGATGMSQLGLTDFNLRDRLTSIISQETTYYYEISEDTGEEIPVDSTKVAPESTDKVEVRKEVDVNVMSRRDGYIVSGSVISQYLLTGVGLAGYENRVGEGYNTNNLLLAIAVGGGIIAISLFLSFLYIIIKQSILIIRTDAQLPAISLGALLATLITGMFNDNLLMGFTWLILGLIAAIPEVVWKESEGSK